MGEGLHRCVMPLITEQGIDASGADAMPCLETSPALPVHSQAQMRHPLLQLEGLHWCLPRSSTPSQHAEVQSEGQSKSLTWLPAASWSWMARREAGVLGDAPASRQGAASPEEALGAGLGSGVAGLSSPPAHAQPAGALHFSPSQDRVQL